MSSLSPVARPVLGALALAAALALTACGGGPPEQVGTAAAPAPAGSASAAPAGTAPAGGAPAEGTSPSGEPTDGRAATAATAPAGDPAEPTGGPAEGTAEETTEEPAEEPAIDAAEETADGTGGTADGADDAGGEPARRGGPDRCATSALEVSAAPAGGAAGSVHVDLTVTNAAAEPCVLAGYPGVSFVDADGAALGAPAVRDAGVPGTGEELAPGESATAALRISQAAVHPGCAAREAAGLRVYPPENRQSLVVPFPAEACTGPGIQQLEIQGFGT
ncbi:DUF4232 domain-containing protein [Kocuria sp. KH4]